MSNQTPQYDPLADYLDDLKPSDENAAGWLELRYDFARAEQIIDQALAMLPREPGAEAGCFPKRIHDAAIALHSRFEKVRTYGPECHGFSYPQAARLIPEVEESKVSDAEIFALIAICEAREVGEKMADLIADYEAMNNQAARVIWNHDRRATTAKLSHADGLLDRAHDSARIEGEKGRANEIERIAKAEMARVQKDEAKRHAPLSLGPGARRGKEFSPLAPAFKELAEILDTWSAPAIKNEVKRLAEHRQGAAEVLFDEATDADFAWHCGNQSGRFKWSSLGGTLNRIKKKRAGENPD